MRARDALEKPTQLMEKAVSLRATFLQTPHTSPSKSRESWEEHNQSIAKFVASYEYLKNSLDDLSKRSQDLQFTGMPPSLSFQQTKDALQERWKEWKNESSQIQVAELLWYHKALVKRHRELDRIADTKIPAEIDTMPAQASTIKAEPDSFPATEMGTVPCHPYETRRQLTQYQTISPRPTQPETGSSSLGNQSNARSVVQSPYCNV
ncbi:uncharacterized protein IL334_003087 [Kwoniella shivajii]|uniref:Uncharacterized protein n=1 Tax=Kwoniella shivajii TaxID=564305 RepID=A0ABZ1CXU1_9TREE|nr:hypothetical protein IL334_003087 [Kwoniella shivajii]